MYSEIPIVLITDSTYVIPTSVAINSLIKNKNKLTKYKIFIIYSNLSISDKKRFMKYNSNDITIELLQPENSEYLLSIKDKKEYDYVTPVVLFKFSIPTLLSQYEKVLYIDGDTIINSDLSELYNTNIKNYYAGVVKDAHPIISKAYKKLELDTYFNAGIMLYNIEKILKDDIDEKLNSNEVLNKTKSYFWFEQDTYNVIFNKNVRYLHPKYNFIIESWKKYGTKKCSEVFEISEKEGKKLFKKSVIFHLASDQKPWIYKNGLMRKEWIKYFKTSPFSDLKIGNEVYGSIKTKNNILQNIFSIKNECMHKVINLLGIKIKIKSKKLEQRYLKNKLKNEQEMAKNILYIRSN